MTEDEFQSLAKKNGFHDCLTVGVARSFESYFSGQYLVNEDPGLFLNFEAGCHFSTVNSFAL